MKKQLIKKGTGEWCNNVELPDDWTKSKKGAWKVPSDCVIMDEPVIVEGDEALHGGPGLTWDGEKYVANTAIVEENRYTMYTSALREKNERGLTILGKKVRGGGISEALAEALSAAIAIGDSNAAVVGALDAKMETLKDTIEEATTIPELNAIDVSDDSHWT